MGATALYAFGSRNRGDHGPASDLDLFIDHVEGNAPSFFRLTELELKLQSELGFPVHITTRRALDKRVKPNIESEASQIF
ncbi:MAG: DNA polymerase III subunit beta [Rhodospirillales bacterium]|nr:DNA polymerase III subunit beta [Rhodospirillales bacterium]